MAQIYLVAPAHRFVEYAHGPLTEYDETQLRAYYRTIPDMQRPTPVFGSTPLGLRLGFPRPPTSPRHGIPAPMVDGGYDPESGHTPNLTHLALG